MDIPSPVLHRMPTRQASAAHSDRVPARLHTVVLDIAGMYSTTQQNLLAAALSGRPRIAAVEVDPMTQTVTVVYDPGHVSVAELIGWVRDCGFHCAHRSGPGM
jgi:Cu2+-exporting ATPase